MSSVADNNYTQQIAEIVANYRYEDLAPEVVQFTRLTLIDAIGCFYRGGVEDLVPIMAAELGFEGEWDATKLLPGSLEHLSAMDRALLFGTSTHAIDYDDSHPVTPAHVGAPVISAVLSLVRIGDYTWQQVITAIVAGYEGAGRIGQLLKPIHYAKGFHTTASLSVFGATAACANLLGLSVQQTCRAFGLAVTQVGGVKSTFGTMAKPFNAGKAAQGGVISARLAGRGFTAQENGFEVSQGLIELFDGKPPEEISIAPASEHLILANAFKIYAACHFTHPMIEALLSSKDQYAGKEADITSVTVTVAPLGFKTAHILQPVSGLETKFSFPHIAAMVLHGVDVSDDAAYSDESVNDAAVLKLRDKVTMVTEETMSPSATLINITFNSGEAVDVTFDLQANIPTLAQLQDRLADKFMSNAGHALGDEKAKAMLALMQSEDSGFCRL